MCVEFVEEVHHRVRAENGHAHDHMFLRLRAMAAVRPALFLSLNVIICQFLKLNNNIFSSTINIFSIEIPTLVN